MDDLLVAAEERASRGTPRGSADVLAGARIGAARHRRHRTVAMTTGAAIAVMVAATALLASDRDDIRVVAGPATTPITLTEPTATSATSIATTAPAPAPCPPPRLAPGGNPAIKMVDAVFFGGITYVNLNPRQSAPASSILGPQFATVCDSYITGVVDGTNRNGDATALEVGAPIYRLKGYDSNFRLAAIRNGQIVIFEAFTNPAAKVGRDLIDLTLVEVSAVVINSANDGVTSIARIDDTRLIARLVELLHRAPVDQTRQPIDGMRYHVEFQLADGTSLNRSLSVDLGIYANGIEVGSEFTDIIRAAAR